MKKIPMLVALLSLTGCAFAPEKAYPIFRFPTTEDAKNFEQNDEQKKVFGEAFTIDESKAQLMRQRLWYLHLAERRQEAVFNQSDWSLGGATLGTIGGLAKSVPTAAVGALVGGGASMVASRYSLNGQTTIYLKAAEQAGCIWAVVGGFVASQPTNEVELELWRDSNTDVARRATLGALQIQAEVRTTLLSLTPAAVSPQDLVKLFNDYRDQKRHAVEKSMEVQGKRIQERMTTQGGTSSATAMAAVTASKKPAAAARPGGNASSTAKQVQKDLAEISGRNQMQQSFTTSSDSTNDSPPVQVGTQFNAQAPAVPLSPLQTAVAESATAQAAVAATDILSCVAVGKPAASL